eukprot:2241412-Prymnesium_polylepis.1
MPSTLNAPSTEPVATEPVAEREAVEVSPGVVPASTHATAGATLTATAPSGIAPTPTSDVAMMS